MLPDGVSVTLVEPKGPVNVGHVARLVRNFGVKKLYLVKPRVDMSVAAMYASHASDVLDGAIITTFDAVRKQHELLVATTAVKAARKSNIIRRSVSPDRLHELLSGARSSSLVFGRDTTGLTNGEVRLCDVTTTIEARPGHSTLNLANAAAIVLYMASRGARRRPAVQSRQAREVFAKGLHELGEASRMPRHKGAILYETGKRLAADSGLTDRQLHLLAGVFRKALTTIESLQDEDSKT